jgi:hypothetical protein
MTEPADGGAPVPVTVRYRYEMERPADQAVRWAVFAALLVLGLLIPLLLLLVAKWLTAKIPGSALSWLTVSGSVGHGTSFLNQEILDLSAIRSNSLSDGDRRSVSLTPRATLRAKANLRSLASPGQVVVEGGPAVTSTGDTLPLAVQNHWIAVLDPSNPAGGAVEVTFLLAPGAAELSGLLSDARDKLPALVDRLRQEHGIPQRAPTDFDNERPGSSTAASPPSGGSDDQW